MIEICFANFKMKSCLWHGEIKTFGFDEIRLWRMKYLPSANVVVSIAKGN